MAPVNAVKDIIKTDVPTAHFNSYPNTITRTISIIIPPPAPTKPHINPTKAPHRTENIYFFFCKNSPIIYEEYNDGDEEEADLALDKLEAVYGSEYKLLKALKVDEIRWFTAMNRDIIVTIKVDKDDLYHNYADLINNPSIKKDTVKILELELNESLKKRYKKFPLKESTSKEKL